MAVHQVFHGSLEKTRRKTSNSFHPELLAHREEKMGGEQETKISKLCSCYRQIEKEKMGWEEVEPNLTNGQARNVSVSKNLSTEMAETCFNKGK